MNYEVGKRNEIPVGSEADLLFMEKLDPASLFAGFCLAEQHFIRLPQEQLVTIITGRNHNPVIKGEHVALPSFTTKTGRDVFENLLLNTLELPGHETFARFGNYFQTCLVGQDNSARNVLTGTSYRASPFLYDLLNRLILKNIDQPTVALQEGFKVIRWFRDNQKDPFTYTESEAALTVQEEIVSKASALLATVEHKKQQIATAIAEQGTINMQLMLLDESGEKYPAQVTLAVGALEALVGENLSVAIWGPTFSGKSTMLAQLISFLPDFMHRLGLDNSIQVTFYDADYATPDVVRKVEKKDFGHISSEETRKWTVTAAHEIVRSYFQTTHGNVSFVNMPGGGDEPVLENPIMELLSQTLDGCILIIRDLDDNDWDEYRKVFGKLIKRSGSKLVSLIRSREDGETTRRTKEIGKSSITSVTPRGSGPFFDRIGARVVELTGDNPNTEFYDQLVILLLLGVLPKIALDRLDAKAGYYKKILKEYA